MNSLDEKTGQIDGIRRRLSDCEDAAGYFVLTPEDVDVVLSEIDYLRELVREMRDG